MRTSDPRIRHTLNQISQNLESANESAQEGLYTFSHNYIEPCLSSVRTCLGSCTSSCFPLQDDQLRRRKRGRSRGRAESNFDFYDDWDYDEDAAGDSSLLGWGHDELERLLAGSSNQPQRNRRMSYGARRKGSILPNDERQDPTVIPSSSIIGFLERFPWRIGARGIRYRPSGADLEENPGGLKRSAMEHEPLLEGSDESDRDPGSPNDTTEAQGGRQRSATQSSRETNNSLSSRGDLFPSDEEDAVPLDDEFAMTLAPRFHSLEDDHDVTRRSASGTSLKENTPSRDSKSTGKRKSPKSSTGKSSAASKSSRSLASGVEITEPVDIISIEDLKDEEERTRKEEEKEIARRRKAARDLASARGLSAHHHIETAETYDSPAERGNDTTEPTTPQDNQPAVNDPPLAPSPGPQSHESEPEDPTHPQDHDHEDS